MRKNSCLTSLLAGLLAAAVALPALAFDRPFPPSAKRGKMTPAYYPEIVMDGKTRRMSPSSRIFNQDNMIEMPASLRGKNIVVNYSEDGEGNIDRVWILTADEAARTLPAQVKPAPLVRVQQPTAE